MSLNHQDVQALLKLLDDSSYNELTLQLDSFTLSLQRNADGSGWQQSTEVPARAQVVQAKTIAATTATAAPEPAPSEAGLLEVRAPMVGTWYRAPMPGAEPFIQLGSSVSENTVVGIIEAMKLMTSIAAKQHGTVVEIVAPDATLVEKGQLLLRVRPQ